MNYDQMPERILRLLLISAVILGGLAWHLEGLRSIRAVMADAGISSFEPYPPLGSADALTVATMGSKKEASTLVRVPNVSGLRFSEAGPVLFRSGLLTEGYGETDGVVVRQVPTPNQMVERGASVKIWLKTNP